MTMPPMSGNGPFDYGDDTVAARLSVDIPADAQANLNQLVTHAHDLRVNMEASARAQGDFIEYLRALPQVMAQADQATQDFFSSAQGAMGGQRRGRNDARHPDFTGQPGSGMGRLDQQLEYLRNTDPRQYANLMAQNGERTIRRGGDPPTEPRPEGGGSGGAGTGPGGAPAPGGTPGGGRGPGRPPTDDVPSSQDWAERFQQMQQSGNRWLTNVAAQTRAGGGASGFELLNTGVAGAQNMARNAQARYEQQVATATAEAQSMGLDEAATAAHVAQATRGMTGTMGSMAGTATKVLGVAGAAVGVGIGVQKAGEWYQGMHNQGAVRGGGAKEGMGFEMGVRTMAMNPFLTTEQSRKIMTSALNEGYTGKEFDTVTEFMADNLKKMNMDVAESVRVLKTNVQKGGQSIGAAQTDIATVSALSRNSDAAMTSGQFRESYSAGMDTVMGGIAPPTGQQASEFNVKATQIMSEDRLLSGQVAPLLLNAAANPAMARIIAPDYNGTPEGALAWALNKEGGDDKVIGAMVGQIVKAAKDPATLKLLANDQTASKAALRFQGMLRGIGVNIPNNLALPLLKVAVDGTLEKELTRIKEETAKAAKGTEVKQKSGGSQFGNVVKIAGDLAGMAVGTVASFVPGSIGKWGHQEQEDQLKDIHEHHALAGGFGESPVYTNDRIEEIISKYGTDDVKIKDKNGKERTLDAGALRDKELMERVQSGEALLKIPGGTFGTLEEFSAQETAASTSTGSGGGIFELSDDAKKLLKLIPGASSSLNQTQLNSNEDYGNARRNENQAGEVIDPPGGG